MFVYQLCLAQGQVTLIDLIEGRFTASLVDLGHNTYCSSKLHWHNKPGTYIGHENLVTCKSKLDIIIIAYKPKVFFLFFYCLPQLPVVRPGSLPNSRHLTWCPYTLPTELQSVLIIDDTLKLTHIYVTIYLFIFTLVNWWL